MMGRKKRNVKYAKAVLLVNSVEHLLALIYVMMCLRGLLVMTDSRDPSIEAIIYHNVSLAQKKIEIDRERT